MGAEGSLYMERGVASGHGDHDRAGIAGPDERHSGGHGRRCLGRVDRVEDRQAELWARILRLLETSLTTMTLAREFGLDVDAQQAFTEKSLIEVVQFLSLSLEGTLEQVDRIANQLIVLPDDAEVMAKQRLADLQVRRLAGNLAIASDMLDRMGLEAARYRQQLIEVTGTVTTDIFDWEVLKGLVSRWLEGFGIWLIDNLPQLLFKLLLFLLVLWIAVAVSRLTRRLVAEGLKRSNLNISQLLKNMIVSTAGGLVLLLGVLFGLAQLGISVGPLLAGLGIAGFIVGFALQDTLGNFASGMLILLYRPYDVGDMIEAGILDPTKVTRYALQNAVSVAGLMITTEAMVAELPKEAKAAAPAMGGMGGMDGMM